jgi:hypothetical protein
MLIASCLGYNHWSPYWVYIIFILTPLVKLFHLDIINLAKHNEEEKHQQTRWEHDYISIVKKMKGINKRLMKAKLKHYKNIKK